MYYDNVDAICEFIKKYGGEISEIFGKRSTFNYLAKNRVYLLDEPIIVKGLYYVEKIIKK